MKLLLWLFVVAIAASAANARAWRYRRSARNEYKMCIPQELLSQCNEMAAQETKSAAKIICIPARDRIDCIDKIKAREVDFEVLDPEDMYVAAKVPDEDFAIFEEIRTKEEPEAEFRYEAVAVIHKDLDIKSVQGIKGLNSCHTGIGRNVGYKIPITKLKNMGIIGTLAEPELSARENELKALSQLFNKACIVGKWSPDPEINKRLKSTYSNLCGLCEHPDVCDYPDNFSGYEGALRCLVHNGGQIAWTKVIYVRKFFGLPVGKTPAQKTKENPDDYLYLCPDGTKAPVTGQPCTWAARPWQGFITNADIVKTIDELRRKIENLSAVGQKNQASWLSLLELNNNTQPEETKIISPGDYLDKANYTDVIERDYGPPFKTLRFCVTSNDEEQKCRALSKAAFSRDIRPRFDCVLEKTVYDCLKSIRDNGADVITLDGGIVDIAQRDYNLKAILSEQYGPEGGAYYAVAVVKKDSPYQSLADLQGAKSCHTGLYRTAGYNAPLYQLLKQNLIDKNNCPYPKALSQFFSGGTCLPGSQDPKVGLTEQLSKQLCSLCVGDADKNDLSSKCNMDSSEAFYGYTGAFRCLSQGGGDVAFVKHVTVPENTDGKNKESWAASLKSSDYELLCPEGGRAPIDQYKKCHFAVAPPHMVVTSNSKSDHVIDEIKSALISAGNLYTKRSDYFKLFGVFNGKNDLLFKDSAVGLASITVEAEEQKNHSELLSLVNACGNSS